MSDYISLAQLKEYLRITDTNDDLELSKVITGASSGVDAYTRRTFIASSGIKYFTPSRPNLVLTPDFLSVSEVSIDDDGSGSYTIISGSVDYGLYPENGGDGDPYYGVYTRTGAANYFPTGIFKGVKMTAVWGYSAAAPEEIQVATLLWSARLYHRKNSPLGIAGFQEFGQVRLIPNMDADIELLLSPFVRWI